MAYIRELFGATYISGIPEPTYHLRPELGALPAGTTHTRASSGTYWDATMTLQTASTNVPRFTYWPGVAGGPFLLREQAATNLFLNSATGATQSITVSAVVYTLSFLGTGTITLSGVSTAGPLVGTGTNNLVSLTFTPTAGSLTCTVSGSCTNVQLETGTGATSRVVTGGSSATRALDVITLPSACVSFPSSSFMLRVAPIISTTGNGWGLYLGQALSESVVSSYNAPSGSTLRVMQYASSSAVVSQLSNTPGLLNLSTQVVAWGGGSTITSYNGVTPVTTTAASPAPGSPIYMLGGNNGSGNAGFTVLIQTLRLWKGFKLNAGQAQQLSAFTG